MYKILREKRSGGARHLREKRATEAHCYKKDLAMPSLSY